MADKQPRDINDFWMKVLSLMLAIMVWFIIKTAQRLPYTNTNPNPNSNQRLPGKSETKTPPPLSNPDGEEKENGSGEE